MPLSKNNSDHSFSSEDLVHNRLSTRGNWRVLRVYKYLASFISPSYADLIQNDAITAFGVCFGTLKLFWGLVFLTLGAYTHSATCLLLLILPILSATTASKSMAVNMLSLGNFVGDLTIILPLGNCQSYTTSCIGVTVVINFYLLRRPWVAIGWLGIVLVTGVVLSLESMCWVRPDYITAYHVAGIHVTHAIVTLALTLLCERDRADSDEERSKFVASVSHELRTPLNGILCASELLLERDTLDEEDLQYIGTIFGCGQLMSSLINNVLDAETFNRTKKSYSGMNANGMFDIGELCQRAVAAMNYIAHFKEVDCRLTKRGSCPVIVKGDSGRYMQVLCNVLSNALKVSPEKSKVTVSIETDDPELVEIAVEDEGPGVPRALREKIFQPWVKLTQADVSGIGLGLTICRTAMEEMSGSIECTSRRDEMKGARFATYLPRARVAMESERVQPAHKARVTFAKTESTKDPSITPSEILPNANAAVAEKAAGKIASLKRRKSLSGCRLVEKEVEVDWTNPKEVIHYALKRLKSLKQSFVAEIVSKGVAVRHGQELVSCCVSFLIFLSIVWMAVAYFVQDTMSVVIVSVGALAGFFCCTVFPTNTARAIGAVFCFYLTATISQVVFSFGAFRTTMSVLPMVMSLLLSNSVVTVITWIIVTATTTIIVFQYDDLDRNLKMRDLYLDIAIDISYYAIMFLCSFAYVLQWRLHIELRDRFLQDMSQELRTPLFGVICAAELLQEKSTLSRADLEHIQTISGCGKLLASLLTQGLDGINQRPLVDKKGKNGESNSNSSSLEIKLLQEDARFCPKQVCSQMVTIMEHVAQAKHLSFTFTSDIDTKYLLGDQSKVSQVLLNILNNAAKVSPPHSTITVTAGLTGDGKMVQFSVEDQGPGVPDGLRESIFKPWVKLTDMTVAGMGLGLAISTNVVKGLGGSIGCGDRLDGMTGARFWFRVPYRPEDNMTTSDNGENMITRALSRSVSQINEYDRFRSMSVSYDSFDSIPEGKLMSTLPSLSNLTLSSTPKKPDVETPRGSTSSSAPTKKKKKKKKVKTQDDQEVQEMRKWYQSQHILIVEDNILNEKLLRQLLRVTLHLRTRHRSPHRDSKAKVSPQRSEEEEEDSVKISTCTNGQEAVEFMASNNGNVQVIFMDLNMPVMGGVEATSKIRDMEEKAGWQKTIIVALTANVKSEVSADYFDEFLSKPLSRDRLNGMLRWVFRNRAVV